MRFTNKLGSAVATALLLAGCGSAAGGNTVNLPTNAAAAGGFESLVKKAKKEGVVSLYAGTTKEATSKWVQDFEDKYGIDVKLYRDGSTTLYQRWAQEVGGGVHNADVLIQNVFQLWQQAKDNGWVTEYKTQNYDAYDFDKVLPNPKMAGTVYPLYQSIGAIAWNTEVTTSKQEKLLREDPVAALANPAFKGQIALADAGGATTAGNYANVILNQQDTYGWDWLQRVTDNDPAIFTSQVPIATQLAKGEYAATFGTDTLYNDYVAEGASIEYRYPKPTSSAVWGIGLPTKTPHPYAARLFMEWATSNEGHDVLTKLGAGTGTRTGWHDEREVAKQSWFVPPTPWHGLSTLPKLEGEGFAEFVNKVNDILRQ